MLIDFIKLEFKIRLGFYCIDFLDLLWYYKVIITRVGLGVGSL